MCPKRSGKELVKGELKDVKPHPLSLPLPIDDVNAMAEQFWPGELPQPVDLSIFVE